MQSAPQGFAPATERARRFSVTPGEIMLLTAQSLLLAASMSVNALIFLRHYLALSPAAASAAGLLTGLLVGYPSIRVVARADGVVLPFYKWAAVCAVAAGLAFALLSAF